ncbi:MAG TPA: FecR domain-containing protein [Longimicrobiaceae bacterium]|jgi:transmembrane sensor
MSDEIPFPATSGDDPDWEALARYLAGESPPAEAESVRAWLAADPEREALYGGLDDALGRLAVAPPAGLDVEAALRRTRERMREPEPIPLASRAARRAAPAAPSWRAPALRAAAAVVLLLGAALAWWSLRERGGAGEPGPAPRSYATAVGERDSLRLPDGTRVLLGPGSRLEVAAGYGERAREVALSGEALFEVPHDEARPFTVRAGPALVRDLGTAFDVRADGAGGVRVVVTEGAVQLRPAAAPADTGVVLMRGDRGVLPPAGRARAERAGAREDDLAWTRGRLVFRDAPVERVAADLRRWYGVELRVADPALAGRRLTASFAGEPREQVLRVVALALGAELELRGDVATLRAGAGPP